MLFEEEKGDLMKESHLILILGLAGFVVMADNWVLSPILPAIARSIQVSPVQAGLFISAYMIPFGLFQLVFGPLADRYGKKQVITFSMIFSQGERLSVVWGLAFWTCPFIEPLRACSQPLSCLFPSL